MRSRLQKALVASLLGAMLGSPAIADVPVYYTEGDRPVFRVNLPDFWTLRSGGDRDVTAPGTDDTRRVSRVLAMEPEVSDKVWLGFVVPDGVSTRAQAEAYLDEIGPSLVRNAVPVGEETRRIGGLPSVVVTGTGNSGGIGVSYTAAMIDLPGPRIAIAVAVVANGAEGGFVEQVNAVFDSFRAVK